MTNQELRKLKRVDLLELLLEQAKEVESLKQRLSETEAELAYLQSQKNQHDTPSFNQLVKTIHEANTAAKELAQQMEVLSEQHEAKVNKHEIDVQKLVAEKVQRTEQICRYLEEETREKCALMEKQCIEKIQRMKQSAAQGVNDQYMMTSLNEEKPQPSHCLSEAGLHD